MTLIKSLLLGSAAGVVAVASAQAADLPTKKGAPAAEYVKICTINVGGTPIVGFTLPGSDTCLKISGYDSAQYTVASHASPGQDAFGMFNRAQLNVDAVSNTAAGPLLAHLEFQADYGRGFDSEYGYTGEVPPYARTQAGTEGWRAPDIVGQLKLTQAWGNVQLAGVGHYANDVPAIGVVGPSDRTWGYGVLGGITFNIPNYAGADIKLQGVYTHDAIGYSGLGSPGNFNYGPQLGYPTGTSSGVLGILADHILNGAGTGYDDSDAYSVAGAIDIPVSATFKVTPEASYGAVTYGNSDAVKADAFVGGGVLEWVPVKNLVFDLDLLYINGSYTEYTAFPVSAKQNYDGFNAKLRIERDF
jgi:hypothetical protein